MKKLLAIIFVLFLAACSTNESTSDEKKVGTRSNPVPYGESIKIDSKIDTHKAEIELKVLEVIRGDKAWEIVKNENSLNEEPAEGHEYVLVKVQASVTDSETEDKAFWLSTADFRFVDSAGGEYQLPAISVPEELAHHIYNGGTVEGFVVGNVKAEEGVKLSFTELFKKPVFFDLE